ncbi:MAG: CotH kinase family protein, partial [Crocinitomicaceae bacterium]
MKKIISSLAITAISCSVFSQSFYDESTIQTIQITFVESNWDALLDAEKAGNEDYIMAQSVTINGIMYDSVGVKYKGNSTYNAGQVKNPFHIELDTYKNHDHEGYTDIKLSNVAKDPSFIREVLGYKILRNYMDAPLSNYANVYVNGSLIGLYCSSEAVSKKFVDSRFGSKTNTFVKCNPPAGAGPTTTDLPDLVYLGQDSTAYYAGYELKSDFGWQELIDLCDTLKNNINDVETILDVDRAIWMLAFDNMTVNLDSYIGGFQQNYYLYRDDYNRYLPVIWDLNESFGTFSMTGSGNLTSTTSKQQMSYLLHSGDALFPLVSQILSIPRYKKMYLAHCKTILEDNFENSAQYLADGQVLQTLVSSSVQADVNKFFTYTNFTSNLNNDVTSGGGPGGTSAPGIGNLMNGRYSYIMGQSEFTAIQPSINSITLSNSAPFISEVINVTATILDENYAYLGYRSQPHAPFVKVEMFDDGFHNDGAAGDDVFGADLPIESALVEYYLYAENTAIGKFSPTNAEHEFYTIIATPFTIGDVVINEFMASNATMVTDQNGDFDDWIEIYNKGNQTIDISGYHLSDNADTLDIFTFPASTTIPANSYIVVWADKDLSQSGFHADFKLGSSGESIYLSDGSMTILDEVTFSSQTTDLSYGRYPNGTGPHQVMYPTFGAI